MTQELDSSGKTELSQTLMTSIIRRLYDGSTRIIHEKWIGTIQAAAVVRSLYLTWTLKKFIPSNAQYNLLDAGSGEGAPLTVIQARRFRKCSFVALDLYQELPAEGNRAIPPNIVLVKDDLFRYSPKRQYDMIFCLDVLEHIENYKKVLKLFYKWTKSRGKLILHVPSDHHVSYFIKNNILSHSNEKHRLGDYHIREGFNLREIITDIINARFEIIYNRYTFSPFTWFFKELFTMGEKKNLPGIGIVILPFIWFSAKLESLLNLSRGNGILIVARKV
jgi:2-polyprenyl-3-methyl-5-hydroxy-6-metoxy-1,4-benzoquinol methylase